MIDLLLAKLKLDKQTMVLIALSCVAIIYLDFSIVIKAQSTQAKNAAAQVKKLKTDLSKLSLDIANFEKLKNQQAQTREKMLSEAKKIISEHEIPNFLQDIYSIANKNKVKVMQINPSKSAAKQKNLSPEAKNLTPYLISLDLLCAYHHLGSFMNDLEKAQSFIEVQDLRISRSADPLLQGVKLTLGTYVKK